MIDEDSREFSWPDNEEQIVHLAIMKGDIKEDDYSITSEEQFTACGIEMPENCDLFPLDQMDITCGPCLTARNGPIAEEFIKMALAKQLIEV